MCNLYIALSMDFDQAGSKNQNAGPFSKDPKNLNSILYSDFVSTMTFLTATICGKTDEILNFIFQPDNIG